MKRLSAILLAVILVTLLSVPAFAVRISGEEILPSDQATVFSGLNYTGYCWFINDYSHVWQSKSVPFNTSVSLASTSYQVEVRPVYQLTEAISKDYTYLLYFRFRLPNSGQYHKYIDIDTNAASAIAMGLPSGFNYSGSNQGSYINTTSVPLNSYFSRFSYFIENDDTSSTSYNTFTLELVLHSDSDVPLSILSFIMPRLFFYQGNGSYVSLTEVNHICWLDPYEKTFEELTTEGIQDILDSIDDHTDLTISEIQSARNMIQQDLDALDSSIQAAASQAHTDAQAVQSKIDSASAGIQNKIDVAADQAHEDQEALQGLISGDPDDAVDSSSLSDDLSDLDDVESDIYDRLDLTVNLGDEEVVIDADIFSKIDEYLDGIEAARFDTDVGSQFNKIWDLIFGYLAIPIILTLTLGSALAFLKGRNRA